MAFMQTTITAVKSIIDADLAATKEERTALKAAIDNPARPAGAMPRVISRAEFMKLAGIGPASTSKLARLGVLKRVIPANGQRGIGYTEESVRAYLEGRAIA